MSKIVFRCPQCAKLHRGLPVIAFDAPAYYHDLTEAERASAVLTDDTCVVDGHHFVRAVLEIPIVDQAECLEWGVWGSLSRANFERYEASFHDDNQSTLGPVFSWFASQLPGYPDASALRCNLVPQDEGARPLIEFHADDHPLVLDQRNGVSLERAIEFVLPVLHTH